MCNMHKKLCEPADEPQRADLTNSRSFAKIVAAQRTLQRLKFSLMK